MKKIGLNQQKFNLNFKSKNNQDKNNGIEIKQETNGDVLDAMANSPQTVSAMVKVNKTETVSDSNPDSDSSYFDYKEHLKDFESRKINDFRNIEHDYTCEFVGSGFLSDEELEDVSKRFTNSNMKKVFDRIQTFDDASVSKNLAMVLTEMDSRISSIEDDFVKDFVNGNLDEILKMEVDDCSVNYFGELEKTMNIVNSYYELKGDFSPIKTVNFLCDDFDFVDSKPVDFLKNIDEQDPLFAKKLRESLKSDGNIDKTNPLAEDFKMALKLSSFEKISNCPVIGDYLYENYYLKNLNIDDKDKNMLLKIKKDIGTKVIIPTYTRNISDSLNYIYDELNDWKNVGKDEIEPLALLYISGADKEFLDDTVGYFNLGKICLERGDLVSLQKSLRHELIHNYDKAVFSHRVAKDKETADLINSIMPAKIIKDKDGKEKKVLDFDNCKYREELLKAGIDYDQIPYAYTNRNEFIAVAGSGDTTQYSPEFKEVLVKIGFPRCVFDLKCRNPKIISNVERVKQYISDAEEPLNFDEYVERRKRGEEYMNFLLDSILSDDDSDFSDESFDKLFGEDY